MIDFNFLAVTAQSAAGDILSNFSTVFSTAFNMVMENSALQIFVLFPVGVAALAAVVGIFVHR